MASSSPAKRTTPPPDSSAFSSVAHSAAETLVITISPPSNPISTRVTSEAIPSPSVLDVLDQHPGHAAGVDERDLEAEEALARLGVDEFGARLRRGGEGRTDVVDQERHVVHPRAAALQEPPHRRVLGERPQQLDAAVADDQGDGLDTLAGHDLAVLDLRAEQADVRVHRARQVVHGVADMMDRSRMHWTASYENT